MPSLAPSQFRPSLLSSVPAEGIDRDQQDGLVEAGEIGSHAIVYEVSHRHNHIVFRESQEIFKHQGKISTLRGNCFLHEYFDFSLDPALIHTERRHILLFDLIQTLGVTNEQPAALLAVDLGSPAFDMLSKKEEAARGGFAR